MKSLQIPRGLTAWCVAAAVALSTQAAPPTDAEIRLVEHALLGGSLQAGERDLLQYLNEHPDSDYVRFGLGLSQFFRSGELLFQSLYQHGFRPESELLGMILPIASLPLPINANPRPISYEQARGIFQTWADDLGIVESTLAQINDPDIKLRLKPGLIRMDFNSDGEATPQEALWVPFSQLRMRFNVTEQSANEFDIALDRGDVSWLRGYCHILMGAIDWILSYDATELFERTGHLFFERPVSPYSFPADFDQTRRWSNEWEIVDWISFFHLISFPLVDRERPAAALQHFQQAVAMSREMWSFYDRETDDDREWIPQPGQGSVIPGGEVSDEIRETWLLFLDEATAVLSGEHVLRYWRATDERGINLNRVFIEPRDFDLILWIQGSAAFPYLEEGELTAPGTWQRLQAAMDRRFFRHAFWFN